MNVDDVLRQVVDTWTTVSGKVGGVLEMRRSPGLGDEEMEICERDGPWRTLLDNLCRLPGERACHDVCPNPDGC